MTRYPSGWLAAILLVIGLSAQSLLHAAEQTGSPVLARAALVRNDAGGDEARLLAALTERITAAGYETTHIGAAELADPDAFNAERFDLLVIPNGADLPAKTAPNVDRWARQGGDLLVLRAPLWQHRMVELDGRWIPREEYQRRVAPRLPPHVLVRFEPADIADWTRSCGPNDGEAHYETVAEGPADGLRSIHAITHGYDNWDTFGSPPLERPYPEGHSLLVFSAKGGPKTTQLAIEWEEKDGSRWLAVVSLAEHWRQYVLGPEDFLFWQSVESRRRDRFLPENASRLRIGLAVSHTVSLVPGKHEYWVGPVGTAPRTAEYEPLLSAWSLPVLDTLSPTYKFFDCHNVAHIEIGADLEMHDSLPLAKVVRASHPRVQGGGFDKGRAWRWVPLLTARDAQHQWRGHPGTLLVHADGPFKGGAWVSFGIADADWYLHDEILNGIGQLAGGMRTGVFILDGGANYYTYFEGQPIRLGVQAFSIGRTLPTNCSARITLMDLDRDELVYDKTWPLSFADQTVQRAEEEWRPTRWPAKGYRCSVELGTDQGMLDRVEHEVHVWRPKEHKQFVTVEDGALMLDGKRWRAHGINYMPSSGIAMEDGRFFEHWLGRRSYDPAIIDRDLAHVRDLGFNSVSIFVYHESLHDQNLLDLLRRLENLGLKANLSLRPGTPMNFLWPKMREIIEHLRLAENDTVFAYDLAWEPTFGLRQERAIWDADWARWIEERYESIANAERDWGVPVPRTPNGAITNPEPHQVDTDGPWRVMVAAYRRFLDTLLYKKYSAARRLVLSVDPIHLVSFRKSEATNPTYHWDGRITYDFPYLAAAVDFLAPEAYGRIGDWQKVKPGWFQVAYGRWAAPRLPVVWAEAGVHTWDIDRSQNSPQRLAFQADFYRDLYRMFIGSGSDGVFFWWYPGGFRYGENSDYGVINPDGSDRPVTAVIRDHAAVFLDAPPPKPADHRIEIDRDNHPDGISGIYTAVQDAFWKAIAADHTPGLRTRGTGTTSADCPMLAVGNTPCDGANPPKFLDAAFDRFEVRDADGSWTEIHSGDHVRVRAGQPVLARATLTNLGEARWLSEDKTDNGTGTVEIVAVPGRITTRTPLPASVGHADSITCEFRLCDADAIFGPTEIVVHLSARGRTPFGERIRITLEPIQPR